MSEESRKFLEQRAKSKVEFTDLTEGRDAADMGVLEVLAKFRPQDKRTLQLEMLELDEYVIYDYPDQHEFTNWDERDGAKHYLVRKLRELDLPGGEIAVQEVFHVVEALLHNYSIVNVDMQASYRGIRRPQASVPLGINKALRETLGDF